MEFRFVDLGDVRLHVAVAGPPDGPLTILLHGFPEYWYGWRRYIPLLADAGHRVWAPDQRGYNLSDKPKAVHTYGIDALASDVIRLIDAAGAQTANVVGHDWGGAVAWWVATRYADRVRRLVVVNCPHGLAMQRQLRRNLRQLLKSWYMFAFQLPWLPERLARRANWRPIVRTMQNSSRPGTFTDEDFEQYRKAWSQPGAFRSMIHWYRAVLRAAPNVTGDERVAVPTLLIWGAKDKFLGQELASMSIDLCDQGQLMLIESATHWVQHEEPERVGRAIIDFLARD